MFELTNLDSIQIGLASPEKIREWSHGEVKKPETINYRTLKPERDGLFCERIFRAHQGLGVQLRQVQARASYKGVVCDKCGVEVTRAKVRRERMGHIRAGRAGAPHLVFQGHPLPHGHAARHQPRARWKRCCTLPAISCSIRATPAVLKAASAPHRERIPRGACASAAQGASAWAWAPRRCARCCKELDLDELSRPAAQGDRTS